MKKALILVDIQNDFLPGGALAVPDGDKVVPVANDLIERFGSVPYRCSSGGWHGQVEDLAVKGGATDVKGGAKDVKGGITAKPHFVRFDRATYSTTHFATNVHQTKRDRPLIVATQDWHPVGHGSFAGRHSDRKVGDVIDLNGLEQILWPDHCVQGTAGADLAAALKTDRIDKVFRKGTDAGIDSYSGFFDNGRRKSTGLGEYLKDRGVEEVFICGLATDYCVKATALDAVGLGFRTYLIKDACRGVNLNPGDVDKAIEEMKSGGVRIIESDDLRA